MEQNFHIGRPIYVKNPVRVKLLSFQKNAQTVGNYCLLLELLLYNYQNYHLCTRSNDLKQLIMDLVLFCRHLAIDLKDSDIRESLKQKGYLTICDILRVVQMFFRTSEVQRKFLNDAQLYHDL